MILSRVYNSRKQTFMLTTQKQLSHPLISEISFAVFRQELDNISDWMRVNKVSVNPDKTEFMVIGKPRRTNKVTDLPPFFLGRNQIN